MKYEATIREICIRTIEVEADSTEDAAQAALDAHGKEPESAEWDDIACEVDVAVAAPHICKNCKQVYTHYLQHTETGYVCGPCIAIHLRTNDDNAEKPDEEVILATCTVCNEDYTEAEEELSVTSLGVVCDRCIRGIRSVGETITVGGKFGEL